MVADRFPGCCFGVAAPSRVVVVVGPSSLGVGLSAPGVGVVVGAGTSAVPGETLSLAGTETGSLL